MTSILLSLASSFAQTVLSARAKNPTVPSPPIGAIQSGGIGEELGISASSHVVADVIPAPIKARMGVAIESVFGIILLSWENF